MSNGVCWIGKRGPIRMVRSLIGKVAVCAKGTGCGK